MQYQQNVIEYLLLPQIVLQSQQMMSLLHLYLQRGADVFVTYTPLLTKGKFSKFL